MKTKNHCIVVSVILALSVANTFAQYSFEGQNACDIKRNLHEQLAGILTSNQGIRVLNLFRQNLQDICQDPLAHNAIIDFVDMVWEASNNANVMKSLELLFAWTRKLIKNPNLQAIYRENVEGLHYLADNEELLTPLTDRTLYHITNLVNNPHFDTAFEPLMENVSKMMNFSKDMQLFGAAAKALLSKPQSPTSQPPKPQTPISQSPRLQSLKQPLPQPQSSKLQSPKLQSPKPQSPKPQSPKQPFLVPQSPKSQPSKPFPYRKEVTPRKDEIIEDEIIENEINEDEIGEDESIDDESNASRDK